MRAVARLISSFWARSGTATQRRVSRIQPPRKVVNLSMNRLPSPPRARTTYSNRKDRDELCARRSTSLALSRHECCIGNVCLGPRRDTTSAASGSALFRPVRDAPFAICVCTKYQASRRLGPLNYHCSRRKKSFHRRQDDSAFPAPGSLWALRGAGLPG